MQVKELIKTLRDLPQDAEVLVRIVSPESYDNPDVKYLIDVNITGTVRLSKRVILIPDC